MPSLQLHQLRVAAVGKLIGDNFREPINTRDVILACLFHDMGNIIKSDLTVFPEFREPEGLEYWERVKEEYVQKYGADHHMANSAIAREIDLPKRALELIDGVGFSKLPEIAAAGSDEQKACEYADLRVGPYGILPMKERIEEGRRRYLSHGRSAEHGLTALPEQFQEFVAAAASIEGQLFASTNIKPEDITDDAIKDDIETLRDYSLD